MDDLALYIHWPFCLSKCPYCDFNSHVRDIIPQARMAAALRAELAFEAARIGPRRLTSIFFGGGTPSLLDPEHAATLINDAQSFFPPAQNIEITLEANPTSIEARKFAAYAEAGVNRVSIGVQSFDPDALKFLGREHSAAQAIAAIELAKKHFSRLSFDLIYARPGQTEVLWRAELHAALSLAADHLSLYQLTIEDGTRFATLYARGAFCLPDEELAASLYDATAEEADKFGLKPYEISNYAVPAAKAATTSPIGAMATMPALGRGPMAALPSPAAASPPPATAHRKSGPGWSRRARPASPSKTRFHRATRPAKPC